MPNGPRLLELALKGLEAERARIDEEITQIRSQMNGSVGRPRSSGSVSTGLRRTRTMSPEARRRISEAMKRRHAERRRAVGATAVVAAVSRRQGGISAAGRRKLSEMMKARWAAKRRAAKK
jgi:hypothetical protein